MLVNSLLCDYEQVYDCGVDMVLDQLEQTVKDFTVPVDGEAIAQALRIVDALNARIAVAVGDFDDDGLWDLEGRTSMTDWLVGTCNIRGGVARAMAGNAARLPRMPVTVGAWVHGRRGEG